MSQSGEIVEAPGRTRRALAVLRAALAGEEHDYTRGDIGYALLLLAIPMMLEMAMESVFAIVDIFFVRARTTRRVLGGRDLGVLAGRARLVGVPAWPLEAQSGLGGRLSSLGRSIRV